MTLQFRSQKATTLSPLIFLCPLKPMLSPPFLAAVVVQGQLRRRAPASNGKVRQDKLPELLQAQFRRNAPGLHAFRHFDPQRKGSLYRIRRRRQNSAISEAYRWVRGIVQS